MSATSTIPKRETAQHFMVNAEATSAVSRVGQSSVFGVGQMPFIQTQTNDSILNMFAQSDQCMPDAGGEATGQQTMGFSDTLASLVGSFDAIPFQSDGEQQVSTGNSLPESFHEAGKEIKPLALTDTLLR